MHRLNIRLSIPAIAILVLAGCNPPTETIPTLKEREKPPINIVSEWRIPGYNGSGWTTSGMSGSGITWSGSGVTWSGSGITWSGSGITFGSGMTIPRSGIRLPGSGLTVPGAGMTVPSSGIRLPSQGIRVPSSGVTAPGGIRVPQSGVWKSPLVHPVSFRLPAAAGETSQPADDRSVTVKLVDFEGFNAAIAKHKGKVVVVDVWSTSCVPCMKEFPNLVQLAKSRPEQVACVSLNVDYIGLKRKTPDSYVPAVQKFLEKQQAQFTNFLSKEADEAIRAKLEISSIPAILIYDQQGELAHRVTVDNSGDELTYAGDVVPKVEALLK